MGGRGQTAPQPRRITSLELVPGPPAPVAASTSPPLTIIRPAEDLTRSGYTVIKPNGFGVQAYQYAIIERVCRQQGCTWSIVRWDADFSPEQGFRSDDVLGRAEPTLRWVNGTDIVDLYVGDLDAAQFLKLAGLELSLAKGGFVLSKRLSRTLSDHPIHAHFDRGSIRILYQEQDEIAAKVWDGAGIVSRQLLLRMIDQLPETIPDEQRRQLIHELRTGHRFQFTAMGVSDYDLAKAGGQDKGHVIVSDALTEYDFILPRDTKGEVRLTNGQAFIAFTPVHGRADMRMEIQSIVNLHNFLPEDRLLEYLRQESTLFDDALTTGRVNQGLARITRGDTLDDVTNWHVREFVASGGDVRWFPTFAKAIIDQHLKRLNESNLGKMRLPIPGGRYYVMPQAVGQRAGHHIEVAPGEILIDEAYGTAWVNDSDWVSFDPANQSPGIAGILGGADNDDGLWVHPFTDYDDTRKVLIWRSPNQPGEYVVLRPAAASADLPWSTVEGDLIYPPADSRRLPPRIDQYHTQYLDLAPADSAMSGSAKTRYSLGVMDETIQRVQANRGALGAYCNYLMITMAAQGHPPSVLPARLEDVIDGDVKDGRDLSQVLQWVQTSLADMRNQGTPIPTLFHDRLGVAPEGTARPKRTFTHWTDHLTAGIQDWIGQIRQRREDHIANSVPPQTLFEQVASDSESRVLASQFNQQYTAGVLRHKRQRQGAPLTETDYRTIAQRSETWLDQFSPEQQRAILRAALVNVFNQPTQGQRSDAAVWQLGAPTPDGRRAPGIAHRTLHALREVGILDEMTVDDAGKVMVYPAASTLPPSQSRSLQINGVWFNLLRAHQMARGEPIAEKMQMVSKELQESYKQQIREGSFAQRQLMVHQLGDRLVLYTEYDNLFGYIDQANAQAYQPGQQIMIQLAMGDRDGNLRTVVETVQ